MAVSVFKTFSAGEVLTASDLNSSLTQITDNGEDLGWPATKAKDLNGFELILDADADTSITADTDDVIHYRLQGVDLFIMDGDVASPVNGLSFVASATGADVVVLAQGSDSNIDIDIQPKGSGIVLIDSVAVSGDSSQNSVLGVQVYS